jgi:hypothetical protein
MNKVTIIASNGIKKVFKAKGAFDVLFTALAPTIRSTYFFKQKDLDYINNNLTKICFTAYDARVFVIGGRNAQITSLRFDGRTKESKTLPYFHWDYAYQFMMDNATAEDVSDWLRH